MTYNQSVKDRKTLEKGKKLNGVYYIEGIEVFLDFFPSIFFLVSSKNAS